MNPSPSRCDYEGAESCQPATGTTGEPYTGSTDPIDSLGEYACNNLLSSEDDHLAPNPLDCHSFFFCAPDGFGGYNAREQPCQGGLAFNDEKNWQGGRTCYTPIIHVKTKFLFMLFFRCDYEDEVDSCDN